MATENAPEGKQSWYAMFPQLGAPLGLFMSSGLFWIILHLMPKETLLTWGWRLPFLFSILLIAIGLWVRLSITETPAFQRAIEQAERVKVPAAELFRRHKQSHLLGTFAALATFVLFYIGTAYLLSFEVKVVHISLKDALAVQIWSAVVFGLFIPLSGKIADRFGPRQILIGTTVLIAAFSFLVPVLMTADLTSIVIFATLAMALMGLTYGLIGAALAAPFPTAVRYTGASLTFNFAGIFGASLAPYIATYLQHNYGLGYVGYYMFAAAVVTLLCILATTKDKV